MTELLVRPTLAGFGVAFGDSVITTKLDGGASRTRLDKVGATHEVQAQWMLTATAYNYLMAFYRTEVDYGSLPFTLKMKSIDKASLETYTAKFSSPPSLTAFYGNIFQVSATLEVTPLAHDEGTDQATIAAGPA